MKSLSDLLQPFPWSRYSKKVVSAILRPKCVGEFSAEESQKRGMLLAIGQAGSCSEAHRVILYWLVDRMDGTIVDARFQVFGQSALIAAAEISCCSVVGKNYDQASRMSADFLESEGSDQRHSNSFPPEAAPHLNLVLEAMDEAAEQCRDLPLPASYAAPPVSFDPSQLTPGEYPGWETLSKAQKIGVIEQVIEQDIRPYIELDAGGVRVKDLHDQEVIIAYEGSCTTCYSATGATLSYIQQVLQSRVFGGLKVIPDLLQETSLNLS